MENTFSKMVGQLKGAIEQDQIFPLGLRLFVALRLRRRPARVREDRDDHKAKKARLIFLQPRTNKFGGTSPERGHGHRVIASPKLDLLWKPALHCGWGILWCTEREGTPACEGLFTSKSNEYAAHGRCIRWKKEGRPKTRMLGPVRNVLG